MELDMANLLGADADVGVGSVGASGSSKQTDEKITRARISFNFCVITKDYKRAQRFFRQLETLDSQYSNIEQGILSSREWQPVMLVGLMWEGLGDLDRALSSLQAATTLAEHHREALKDPAVRLSSFGHDDVASIFVTAARICVLFETQNLLHSSPRAFKCVPPLKGASWAEQALLFLEQGKARHLLDSISKGLDTDTVGPSMQKWMELSHHHPETSKSVPIKDEYETEAVRMRVLQQEIQQYSPLFKSFFAISNPSVVEYALIPPKVLLLEVGVSDDVLMIICVDNTGVIKTASPGVTSWDIQTYVGIFRRNIVPKRGMTLKEIKTAQSRVQRSIVFLSKAIIEPIKEQLHNREHIVFIPSSSLTRFPFGVLRIDGTSLSFLYTVTESPSLLTFLELSRRKEAISPIRVSIIANPSLSVSSSSPVPIPGSYFESIYIAKMLRSKVHLSSEIDHSRVRDMVTKSNIVHLAAHGTLDYDKPLRSSILLEPAYTVADLSRTPCHASLVVFSACLSGLGRVTFGEDLLGFAHAILCSGAKAFIGSLWSVDDIASMIFMILFYKALIGQGTTPPLKPAHALKKAICELCDMDVQTRDALIRDILTTVEDPDMVQSRPVDMESKETLRKVLDQTCDFTDPWYWAPFVLTGYGI
jgi:CHAT domain-containing protein